MEGRVGESPAPEVRAAGGVVLRAVPGGGIDVLLVHRSGHRDWTLPKGKADAGEPDDVCALREVAEETGLACRLGPELGATRYHDRRGRPKRVRYWAMTVRDGRFTPNAEVDEVRWLPLSAAAGQASYPGDRAVLARLAAALRGLLLVVRHARAVEDAGWSGDDRTRPLDAEGRRQAADLARPLAGYPLTRLLASPSDRCLQTLEPLSARIARPVEHHPALAEGASPDAVRGLLAGLGAGPVVVCTHADVMAILVGSDAPREEGSVWLLARDGPGVRRLRYWPPP